MRRRDKGRDRILIFEDTDGDGKFDKRTVFAEGLNLVSGLEVGFGGVWVGAAPYLLFIPDRERRRRARRQAGDSARRLGLRRTRTKRSTRSSGARTAGSTAATACSRIRSVGKPGTPDDERMPINAGIWRYHPTRHEFEVFAEGTSNPWGVDFNDHGQAFCTACVIPHLFHIIQGGRYQRQAGEHFNPYTYDDIKTIADHRHYLGDTPHAGNGRSDEAGGGHAHAGAMIYLGGAWPEEYRNQIFMNNIHGQRHQHGHPQAAGLGLRRQPRPRLPADQRPGVADAQLPLRARRAGVSSSTGTTRNACHHTNVEGHDRTNGRIYKVSYGDAEARSRSI